MVGCSRLAMTRATSAIDTLSCPLLNFTFVNPKFCNRAAIQSTANEEAPASGTHVEAPICLLFS
jgi:hypothetical protein